MSFPKYPKYKDSGVEWLGVVPEHWEVKKVSHIADLIAGFAFPSEQFGFDPETGIPTERKAPSRHLPRCHQRLEPKRPLKPSGIEWLGDVPEHWNVFALKHLVARPIIDGPHVSPQKHDEGVPFISAESIGQGFIDFDKKWGYISPEDHKVYSHRYKPERGDILLVKLGATTGVPAIVETDIDFRIWVPLAAIRLKKEIQP